MANGFSNIKNIQAQADALKAVKSYLDTRRQARAPQDEQDGFQKIKEYTDDEGNVFVTTGKFDETTGEYSDTRTQALGRIGKPKAPSDKTVYNLDNVKNTAKAFGVEDVFKDEININFEELGIDPNSVSGQTYLKKTIDKIKNYDTDSNVDKDLNYADVVQVIKNTYPNENDPKFKKAMRLANSAEKITNLDARLKRFRQALDVTPDVVKEEAAEIYESTTLRRQGSNKLENYITQKYPDIVEGTYGDNREDLQIRIKQDEELNSLYRNDIRQNLAYDSRKQKRPYTGQVVTDYSQINLKPLQNTEIYKEFIREGNSLPATGLSPAQAQKEMEEFYKKFFDFVQNKQNSFGANPADAFNIFIADPITPETLGRRPNFLDALNARRASTGD